MELDYTRATLIPPYQEESLGEETLTVVHFGQQQVGIVVYCFDFDLGRFGCGIVGMCVVGNAVDLDMP